MILSFGCDKKREPFDGHVIVLLLDTLSANHLSLYGYSRATDPHLKELGAESIVVEQAFASAPWTLPSHYSLFTGLFPHHHGVTQFDTPPLPNLNQQYQTVTEHFKKQGYATAWFAPTDNFELSLERGLGKGFDQVKPAAFEVDRLDQIYSWLKGKKKSFSFVHTYAPLFVSSARHPFTRLPVSNDCNA